jgi:hypothetical protein
MALIMVAAYVPIYGLILIYGWDLIKRLIKPAPKTRPIKVRSANWSSERRSWSNETVESHRVRTKVGCSN